MNIFWWIFGLYIAPAILTAMFEDGSPFTKENSWKVFVPFVNLWFAVTVSLICIAATLISFGDFCEDVWKSFKKHFC